MRRLYGVMVDEDVIKKLPGNGSGYTAEEIEAMATRVIPTYRVKQDMIDYAKKIYNKQHNRLVELNFEKGLDPDGNEIRVQGRLICRKVFGISVDKETFDQYQQKRYQVCDKNFPMNIVEIYANSKEIETELPEMSKAAKKIINEATKEINTKFGYKNISEEGKNMKKNHLSDYLKEMQKLRDEAAMRTQEIDEHWREEQEKYSEVTGINGFVTNLDWNLLGTTIGNGFNMAIDSFYGFVSTLDWSKLGTSLGESIQSALTTIDWETLGKSVSDGFIGLLDFITEAIYAIDWKQLGNDVAAVVKNIDWDGVSDALFEGIGAALGALAAFLQGLLEDAWNSVVDWWYDAAYEDGEFTMEGLLNGITEKLTDIGNWIDEHIFQPFMEGFRNVFGIHSPSTVMQEMGGYIIDGLKEGLLGIWEKVEWIITEFKEKLKEAFTNAKNNTISIFSSMKTKMVDIFKGMWSGMKNVINTIINGIEFMVNRVVDGINNMINALNRLSFDIPDWVPQLGGKSFGFSIPTIPTVSIPRLANGGITTGSTLANIGEAGREAVLPLENNTGWMDDLASKLASKMPDYSGAKTVMLAVDGKEFARINLPYLQDEEMRLGIVEG